MPLVLDASVAASWFFPDESHPVADQAWRLMYEDEAIAPAQWWFEIRNTLLVGERRARLSAQGTNDALARLSRMLIRLQPTPNEHAVFSFARKHRLTFYDSVYLELAKREGLALATLDDQLADAARVEGVALITE